MSTIRVPVKAYILTLYPQTAGTRPGRGSSPAPRGQLRPLANGLAVPSFWSRQEITTTFVEANRIWSAAAQIEFTPIDISQRSESVPADHTGMWQHFVNNLSPRGRGIAVGFVNDIPDQEGGWGGGRVAILSGRVSRSGLAGFGGNLLAHELGHVLMGDPNHRYALGRSSNLMYGRRHPRVVNAGLLTDVQVAMSRRRARSL